MHTQDQVDSIRYGAFFDELGQLEKHAMIKHAAGGSVSVMKGLSNIFGKGFGKTYGAKGPFQKAWKSGVKGAGKDAGWLARAKGGLKGLWGSDVGRATLVGGGTLAGGALAAGGAGHLMGRNSGGGGGQQNVIVR